MKLSLCMLFPSLAAGFAVRSSGAGRRAVHSVSPLLDVSSGVGTARLSMVAKEQPSEAAGTSGAESEESTPKQTSEAVDPPSSNAVASEASPPASDQETKTPSQPATFVQAKAAPTFSATAPAGVPPEYADAGGRQSFQRYRTLDQEMNAQAAQRGFARAQNVRASMSATTVSENPNSGYYKYSTLNQLENQKAAQTGFAKSQGVKASMSATDATAEDSDDSNPNSGYYKYSTLNQLENQRAAQTGFARTTARATFSATDVTNDAGGGGFYKYKTLSQEDNERALNASYRVTYSATPATDSASSSRSNIPVVKKKADEDEKKAPVDEPSGEAAGVTE